MPHGPGWPVPIKGLLGARPRRQPLEFVRSFRGGGCLRVWGSVPSFSSQKCQPPASGRVAFALCGSCMLENLGHFGLPSAYLLGLIAGFLLREWLEGQAGQKFWVSSASLGPTAPRRGCWPPVPARGSSRLVRLPGASRGEGGTCSSPPALGSQKRDPEAPWASRWPLPSTQSGSGAAHSDPLLQRLSPLCRSPQGWPGDEPRGGAREEPGGDVHSAEGSSAAHAEEDGIECECLRAAEQLSSGGCLTRAAATCCDRAALGVGLLALGSGSVASPVQFWGYSGVVFPSLCRAGAGGVCEPLWALT